MQVQIPEGFEERGQAEAEVQGAKFWQAKQHGDSFLGKLLNVQEGIPSQFPDGRPETHYTFQHPTDGPFVINPTADLLKRLKAVKIGDWVWGAYISDKDIGKKSPMKQYVLAATNDPKKVKALLDKQKAKPAAPAEDEIAF